MSEGKGGCEAAGDNPKGKWFIGIGPPPGLGTTPGPRTLGPWSTHLRSQDGGPPLRAQGPGALGPPGRGWYLRPGGRRTPSVPLGPRTGPRARGGTVGGSGRVVLGPRGDGILRKPILVSISSTFWSLNLLEYPQRFHRFNPLMIL